MTPPQTQAVSIHLTLGWGMGFYGDSDEHLGRVYADFLQKHTDCLTLLEGYITGNEKHAIQHFQTSMEHLAQHHHHTNSSCSTERTYGLRALDAASKKLANS